MSAQQGVAINYITNRSSYHANLIGQFILFEFENSYSSGINDIKCLSEFPFLDNCLVLIIPLNLEMLAKFPQLWCPLELFKELIILEY